MSQPKPPRWPFAINVLEDDHATGDSLPASYHHSEGSGVKKRRVVANPAQALRYFLENELSLGDLGGMLQHLWFAGSEHPATRLHLQIAIGRNIAVADRLDLHLLWANDGTIFIKPVPRFLLDPDFWRSNLACPDSCVCESRGAVTSDGGVKGRLPVEQSPAATCMENPRKIALGFLYTYACLVSSESDFFVANEKHLLPRKADGSAIEWAKWKTLVRELLDTHAPDRIHPRFLRAELRLSRINTIHNFTRLPPFEPYLRGWYNYGSFFRDNLTWMAATTVFVALVLTAMQVGLATDQLKGDSNFQRASYGFTVFAILGPMCAICLVGLGALFNLVKDLPWLIANQTKRRYAALTVHGQSPPA